MKSYLDAQHAMQTGVALKIERDSNHMPEEIRPKHLRVGINTALCDHAALVKLLLSKSLITLEEYEAAITVEMNAEVERYKKNLGLPEMVELA